eukprot:745886-Hanusia_phi.AAC.3
MARATSDWFGTSIASGEKFFSRLLMAVHVFLAALIVFWSQLDGVSHAEGSDVEYDPNMQTAVPQSPPTAKQIKYVNLLAAKMVFGGWVNVSVL